MDLINLALGIAGVVLSAFGLFYAWLAARRSDSLLRRLVIYPFREFDVAFARLNEKEQSVVKALFLQTHGVSTPLTDAQLATISAKVPDAGPAMMSFLEAEGWLRRDRDGALVVNSDRAPYMSFLREAESQGENHGDRQ
jgi:hypothetical protein